MTTIADLEARAGLEYASYQRDALRAAEADEDPQKRLCLYYKTGAGKTLTALSVAALWGEEEVLVLCPPATHKQWIAAGDKLGITVEPISHAKFRQAAYKVARTRCVIVDEFHLLGGHTGKGWKKMDRLATGLQAPLILASATPNYNDAERVYCIQHVLDPNSCRGGFIQFLHDNCETENNPFGMTPIVTGFRNFPDAASYLAALPKVQYLPDDLVYTITDIPVPRRVPRWFDELGLDTKRQRIIASQIEERHAVVEHSLIASNGDLHPEILDILIDLTGQAPGPVLIFANHAKVAEALFSSAALRQTRVQLVTGASSSNHKNQMIELFNRGEIDVLIGTASLATGPDGMDKVCDWMILLDDTDDASLRRQLIGRIMPRGINAGDASKKVVTRLVIDP